MMCGSMLPETEALQMNEAAIMMKMLLHLILYIV